MIILSPHDPAAPGPQVSRVLHWTSVIIVFSITGIISMLFSGLLLRGILHLDGNLWSGPWSYRVAYLLLVPPSVCLPRAIAMPSTCSTGRLVAQGSYETLLQSSGTPNFSKQSL